MAKVAFIACALVVLLGSLGAVALRNVFHAALAMVFALAGVAGLYALLSAGYLAVVQILIYVGAISVLIIMAIMVSERFMGRRLVSLQPQWWVAALASGGLALLFVYIGTSPRWTPGNAPAGDLIQALGQGLVGKYLLPFELVSVVLVGSLIGAIYLARER
jgi:NADH-quinone oxidoreductase subunit J